MNDGIKGHSSLDRREVYWRHVWANHPGHNRPHDLSYIWSDELGYQGGGGGSLVKEEKEEGVRFHIELPKKFGELKQDSLMYGGHEYYNLADDFEFKRWCIFIPSPTWNELDLRSDSLSKFIFDMRKGIGGALGPATVFLTYFYSNGSVNTTISGEIIHALRLRIKDAPLLIISDTADFIIRDSHKRRFKRFKETEDLQYVVVAFGKSTKEEILATMDKLSELLPDTEKQISGQEIQLSRFLIRTSLAIKNLTNIAKENSKYVLPVVIALLKK
jgi:hypothetical protein